MPLPAPFRGLMAACLQPVSRTTFICYHCWQAPRTMPWIKQLSIAEATGLLKAQLDQATQRAGRVWHIVSIMSLNAHAMRDSMALYGTLMLGRSPLSRVQREMLATVVSFENQCHY